MTTSSPRIGFTLPTGSDPMSKGDMLLAANYVRMDDVIGVTFVTNAAKLAIASPFQGQTVYVTDLMRYELWNGSAWVQFAAVGNGVIVGSTSGNTAFTSSGVEAMIPNTSVTFNAITGRTYAIIWSLEVAAGSGTVGDGYIRVRQASGGTVTTAGNLLYTQHLQLFADAAVAPLGTSFGRSEPGAIGWVSTVTGQVTIGLSAQMITNTWNFGQAYINGAPLRTVLVEQF